MSAVERLEPGEYMTRRDAETGARVVSGKCAGCEAVVSEAEPSGRFHRVDVVPKGEAVSQGMFHARCAPIGDARYVQEELGG